MPTRWADNDHYGHVNNVTYYSYFDTAVNGFLLAATGTDIRDLHAIGVVAQTSCNFLGSISFPDLLKVGIRVGRLGNSSISYELAIFRVDGDALELAATGTFTHVYVDEVTRKPVPIPEVIRKAVEPLVVR